VNVDAKSGLDREIGLALRELMQAGRMMTGALARRLGVGVTDLQAMDQLLSEPQPVGPARLGEVLGISSAAATVLVDRLEAAGHLRRHRVDTDRRRVNLDVTESAKSRVRTEMQPMLTNLADLCGQLDPDEARVVLDFLRRATVVIHEYAQGLGEA
jgi:DNA-binding MarR family transcriptional regulator